MKRRLYRSAALCALVGLFYLVNRQFLSPALSGAPGWFLRCYANDIAAGLFLCVWTDLLLTLGGRPPLKARHAAPLLLVCGLVWEVLAPLWKSGAVFDFWDFAAYLAGGLLWLLIEKLKFRP